MGLCFRTMHLCRSWVVFGLLAASLTPLTGRATVVYKWTDADGVVHFSDQPVPGAEKIVTSGGTTRGILTDTAPAEPADKPKRTESLAATRFAISSPAQQQTFSGDQPVIVHLAMEPELKAGQTITWTLNGATLANQPDPTQFTLTDLGRGSYTLEASLIDAASGESKAAEPVTFNVLRPSILSPQHK